MKKDVFISYSAQDLEIANCIVNYLERNGINCFISSRDIPVGAEWATCIIEAIEHSELMVVVFTENYNNSFQVDREITICCDLEKKPIIPVKISDIPLKGLKKFYLSNINWITVDDNNGPYDLLLKAIENNIGYRDDLILRDRCFNDFVYKVYWGNDVTSRMISEAVNIDELVYDKSYRGDYTNCIRWWKRNKYIYVMLEDIRYHKIIGYINAMPITSKLYDTIKKGEIIDIAINEGDIETYDLPDTYNLYISSVVLHPDYHNTGAFKILYDALMLLLINLFKHEIYFSNILADAVSPIGEKLCKYIGMIQCNDSKHLTKIYEGSLLPSNLRPTTKLCKELFSLYKTINVIK